MVTNRISVTSCNNIFHYGQLLFMLQRVPNPCRLEALDVGVSVLKGRGQSMWCGACNGGKGPHLQRKLITVYDEVANWQMISGPPLV